MKRLFFILFALLLIPASGACAGWWNLAASSGAAGQSIDYTQDFEAAGTPANWTALVGTPDFDYSTAGLDLEGSQCLELVATESVEYGPGFNTSSIYFTIYYRFSADLENTEVIFRVRDAADAIVCQVSSVTATAGDGNTGGTHHFAVWGSTGSFTVTGTTDIASGTTYKLKIYCKNDSGPNDGIARLSIWNGVTWDVEASTTNGTNENNIDNISVTNSAAPETMYFDYFQSNSVDIDNP